MGGRLFCWLDRGMEILYRCGIVCPSRRQEQILHTHMLKDYVAASRHINPYRLSRLVATEGERCKNYL
jgi:hypothetical protein